MSSSWASERANTTQKRTQQKNLNVIRFKRSNTHTRIHKITTKKSTNHGTNVMRIDGYSHSKASHEKYKSEEKIIATSTAEKEEHAKKRTSIKLSFRFSGGWCLIIHIKLCHCALGDDFHHHRPSISWPFNSFHLRLLSFWFLHIRTHLLSFISVFFLHHPSAILLQSILHAVWCRIFVRWCFVGTLLSM